MTESFHCLMAEDFCVMIVTTRYKTKTIFQMMLWKKSRLLQCVYVVESIHRRGHT